jgi:hypothetical protein
MAKEMKRLSAVTETSRTNDTALAHGSPYRGEVYALHRREREPSGQTRIPVRSKPQSATRAALEREAITGLERTTID